MLIAKIYSDNKNIDTYGIIEINGIDAFYEDSSIPTLIVGKKNAEKIYGKENVKVLNKQIKNNVFWTFSKTEKRNEYETDIEKFYSYVFNSLLREIKYKSLNVYLLKYNKFREIVNYIDSKKCNKTALVTDKHVYLCIGKNVIGISIYELNYIGVTRDRFITFLKKHSINIEYNYSKFNNLFKKYPIFNKIIVPYIYNYMKNT